jgi:hypothetical protein
MERETNCILRAQQLKKAGYKLLDILEKGVKMLEAEEDYYEELAQHYEDQFAMEGHNNSMDEHLGIL